MYIIQESVYVSPHKEENGAGQAWGSITQGSFYPAFPCIVNFTLHPYFCGQEEIKRIAKITSIAGMHRDFHLQIIQ